MTQVSRKNPGKGPQKHSLYLRGHRTSVSLEPEFWDAFRAIAAERDLPINVLAARIDATRSPGEGLASAIRVFILGFFMDRTGPDATPSASAYGEKPPPYR